MYLYRISPSFVAALMCDVQLHISPIIFVGSLVVVIGCYGGFGYADDSCYYVGVVLALWGF